MVSSPSYQDILFHRGQHTGFGPLLSECRGYMKLEETHKNHQVQLPAIHKTIVSMSVPYRGLNDAISCYVSCKTRRGTCFLAGVIPLQGQLHLTES